MKLASLRSSPVYKIAAWLVVAACLLAAWRLSERTLLQPQDVLTQDFAQLWAAGRLNLAGENPYDPGGIQAIRSQLAGQPTAPAVTPIFYSPPWALPLAMLAGLPPYPVARLAWLLVGVLAVAVSAAWLWKSSQGVLKLRWAAWLAAFAFSPTLSALTKGQVTPLVLLGLAGFVLLVDERRQGGLALLGAGALAALAGLKPQLVYLFWPALLLWSLHTRRWQALAGLGLALLAGLAAGMLFNPELPLHYLKMLREYPPSAWFTPTPGAYLRLWLGEQRFWLQYLPALAGLAWLGWYWWKWRNRWSWRTALPRLVFASILTAPYAWTYDQVVLLSALVPAWAGLVQSGSRNKMLGMALLYGGISLLALVLHRSLLDQAFIWLAPAWLGWWGLAVRDRAVRQSKV